MYSYTYILIHSIDLQEQVVKRMEEVTHVQEEEEVVEVVDKRRKASVLNRNHRSA